MALVHLYLINRDGKTLKAMAADTDGESTPPDALYEQLMSERANPGDFVIICEEQIAAHQSYRDATILRDSRIDEHAKWDDDEDDDDDDDDGPDGD